MSNFACTDAGNAELLAELFNNKLRYDHQRKTWFIFKDHHWERDERGTVATMAIKAARHRLAQASKIEDADKKKREIAFAFKSEDSNRINACLKIAQSLKSFATKPEQWDHNPMLLGVRNGVIDLQTGKLRNGQPQDLITQQVKVEWDDNAECPTWRKFLSQVFNDDEEMIAYIQKALGYCLTGNIEEQCFFLCHGGGSNGKSTMLDTIQKMMGDYGCTTVFSTFELRSKSSIPNDVADLLGKRFVTSSETDEGDRLNEARLKALTGSEDVKARELYGKLFQYTPTFKLWFSVNYLPEVHDTSFGIWRRVRLIRFPREFSKAEVDKQFGKKLRVEWPGILRWMVEGCLKWQTEGLEAPASITEATEEYRRESDPLTLFLEDRCYFDPNAEVRAAVIWDEYENWARDNAHVRKLDDWHFFRGLGHKKFKKGYIGEGQNKARTWRGIGLQAVDSTAQNTKNTIFVKVP